MASEEETTETIDDLIERAHAMLQAGQREEARTVVQQILTKEPRNFTALALRDRIDNEDFSVSLVNKRSDGFEDEDESPVVSIGLLVLSIVAALAGTIVLIRNIVIGLRVGFNQEVTGRSSILVPEKGHFPVQNFFMFPVAMYLIAAIGYYGYRRFYRKP